MPTKPSIPALVIMPSDAHDFKALYAVASAYANSGTMLNRYADQANQIAFAFPAMVCACFAVELFLKFFITLDNAANTESTQDDRRGHRLLDLWQRIKPANQDLIASMFRNPTQTPSAEGISTRKDLFITAITNIGPQPFVAWRYVYEINNPALMSHEAVVEVLDALGYAATYALKLREPS